MIANSELGLEVELSTRCTIGCVACPRHRDWDNRQIWNAGFINLDTIKAILRNTDYKKYNFVGAYGDAIYHPNFIEIIKYAMNLGKSFFVETNGAHRNEEFWDSVAALPWERGKHIWHFSIDGLEDTNHIYRQNSKWSTIMYAVKSLHTAKNRPYLSWKYIVFPYNAHQIDEAEKFSKEIGFNEFRPVKSLRYYPPELFKDESEHRQIDWDFSEVS